MPYPMAQPLQEDGHFTYSIIGMFKQLGVIYTEEQADAKKFKGVQVAICGSSGTTTELITQMTIASNTMDALQQGKLP